MKCSRGIATLEMALCGTLLLGMILGGIGIMDYLEQFRFINLLVERRLGDSEIKPLKVLSGNAEIVVDADALGVYLDDVVDGAASDLALRYPNPTLYFTSIAACAVLIDPMSGAALGVDSSSCMSRLRGALSVPTALLDSTDPLTQFQSTAAVFQSSIGGVASNASLLAVPSGSFGRVNGEAQYVDRAVVVALRAFASLENSVAGSAYKQFGVDLLVYNSRSIGLRGVLQ